MRIWNTYIFLLYFNKVYIDENIIYYHFKNMSDDMKFTSGCKISCLTSVTNFTIVKFHVRSDVRLTKHFFVPLCVLIMILFNSIFFKSSFKKKIINFFVFFGTFSLKSWFRTLQREFLGCRNSTVIYLVWLRTEIKEFKCIFTL